MDGFFKAKGFTRGTLGDRVLSLRLLKSLYGLKQSPLEWYKDIDAKLRKLGSVTAILIAIFIFLRSKMGASFSMWMNARWSQAGDYTCKKLYMGRASLYLGVGITHLPGGAIELSQTRYVEKTLERFGLRNCNGVKLLMKKDLPRIE